MRSGELARLAGAGLVGVEIGEFEAGTTPARTRAAARQIIEALAPMLRSPGTLA
ncbi:hypothetical protein [Microbacterium sp. 18062]|uniref:hypothetical protein n=1 Tax=Microbacterium sp. 18062 TaxID=2681410 RepID=UPI00135A9E1A|nr:hypothetical protein [Microbacterium sp. 18062]